VVQNDEPWMSKLANAEEGIGKLCQFC
jgi:hypothetical protein